LHLCVAADVRKTSKLKFRNVQNAELDKKVVVRPNVERSVILFGQRGPNPMHSQSLIGYFSV